jgi:hypothetical protein
VISGDRLRYFMEVWQRLAAQDRDLLSEHFPDDQRQIGYHDGYRAAAEDVLRFLRDGRFQDGGTRDDYTAATSAYLDDPYEGVK